MKPIRQNGNRVGFIQRRMKKIVLLLWAFWPDRRPRDMNNCHKLLPDALESILYENDRCVLIRDMDFCVDPYKPRIEIIVARKEEVDANG